MKKATKADCIRKAINISSQKDFFKYDKPSYNDIKIKEHLEITCPKLKRLVENITELDKNDLVKYGKNFKHIIYSDVKSSIAGIKLVASVLTAYGMQNVYGSSLTIKLPSANNNFALLSSVAVYEKPFPVKLRNEILKIFNSRPDNIYGEKIRFLLLDQGFKEGIDVFDVKYIHLVDDLITPSDEKQAIGRGTRFCGQKGLTFNPELGWPLHVFKYKLIIDEDKYGDKDAFLMFIKESNIDIKKLYFAAELENICRFGAVDYEINKAIHEFGNEKEDNLEKIDFNEKFKNFNINEPYTNPFNIDQYKSLNKEANNDFKLLKLAYKNFGGDFNFKPKKLIEKKKNKHIDINKVKSISLNKKLDFINMRKYVRRHFTNLKWNNLEFKNNCGETTSKPNRIITLNNSQSFVSNFFIAKSAYKGILYWHSVGTGKTCSAIATASNTFEKEGYTILWVTRHTLKPDVWKNIFKQVCSETIKRKLNEGKIIPEEPLTNKFKFLDNRWLEPMSYKQFTNLIAKKNDYYNEMVKRNGKNDPFKKTLIIIDEAHKLYAEDTPIVEKPDINLLKQAIYNSYNNSGNESCKLLLMTATPYTNDPMQLFKLLNLLKEDDYFPEDFKTFRDIYLDPETYKFREDTNKLFLDKISGYISYVNREKDVRQFAYPVVYIEDVNYSSTNDKKTPLKLIKEYIEDVKDYLTYSNDFKKCKLIINNFKDLIKKPKKAQDIITQEEALDLCINKGEKRLNEFEELITNIITEYSVIIKENELKAKELAKEKKKGKDLEKEEKKKAKELEKEEKKKAKELEKEEKKKAKELEKEEKKKAKELLKIKKNK